MSSFFGPVIFSACFNVDHLARHRLNFLIFLSCWTTLFGAAYIIFAHTGRFGMIASHASHVLWLFLTWVMWLVGAALYTHRLNQIGCGPTHKRCQINRVRPLGSVSAPSTDIDSLAFILHRLSRDSPGPNSLSALSPCGLLSFTLEARRQDIVPVPTTVTLEITMTIFASIISPPPGCYGPMLAVSYLVVLNTRSIVLIHVLFLV